MKLNHLLIGCIVILLAACILMTGLIWMRTSTNQTILSATVTEAPTTEAVPETTEEPTTEATEPAPYTGTLTVALYPYVPDLDLLQNILAEMWAEIEPDVELDFRYWDCYSDPYPYGIDVISYDAMYVDYLVENNFIQPMDPDTVGNLEGILPYAMEGSWYEDSLYGLPYLACSYFLIHYTEDEELAQVQNFGDLYDVLSVRKEWYSYDGLQTDYTDNIPYFYLEALMDYNGAYTTYREMPNINPANETVMERLHEIGAIIPERADYIYDWDFRSRFAQGEGSACYSFSEALYYMENILDQLTIRPISFFEGENICIYYADIASIGSHVTDPAKKDACTKLINLLASPEFQAALCYGNGQVQYLLPAREQVYLSAMEQYPIYEVLYNLATDENNLLFRFGPDIFEYDNIAYDILK